MQVQEHAQQQQDAEAVSQASDQAHQLGMTKVQQPDVGASDLIIGAQLS
jgi:hypothetical protein